MAGARMPIDHAHAQAELVLVVRGSGSLTLDENAYVLKPGTLFWLLPNQRHRLTRSTNLEMWVVMLRPDAIDPAWATALGAAPSHVVAGEELIDLDRLLSQVSQDSDEPETYNAGIAYTVRRAWRATRENPASRRRPMHPAVVRALMLLRDDEAAASLSSLASAAGIAAPYLSRLLIEHTGRSFVDWRNRIRLDRFIRAWQPEANLLAAATAAGFGSYARFHHVFAEVMHCTPSDWAKQGERATDVLGPMPSAAGDYGIPAPAVFTARHRWLVLVPLVAPALAAWVGPGLLDRVLDAIPDNGPRPAAAVPSAAAMAAARPRLIAALATRDPALAADLDALMGAVDFAATYAGILNAFDFTAGDFADGVAALIAVAWVAANHGSDPGPAEAEHGRGQVRDALRGRPHPPDEDAAADIAIALECHFMVLYHALQAARAAGDPRALDELATAAVEFSREAFGGHIEATVLDQRGLARRALPGAKGR